MGQPALSAFLDRLATNARVVVRARRGASWHDGGPEFAADARAIAAALAGYGLGPGTSAAVLGSGGCDTLKAELAVLVAGASLVSVDPRTPNEAVARALESRGVVHAIAVDEDHLRRVLAVRPDLPALELVLLMTARPSERKPAAFLAESAIPIGAAALEADPALLQHALVEGARAQSVAFVGAQGDVAAFGRASVLALGDHLATTVAAKSGAAILMALPAAGLHRFAAAAGVLGKGAPLALADPVGAPDAGLTESPVSTMILSPDALRRLRHAWEAEIRGRSWLGRAIARWSIKQGGVLDKTGWKHKIADVMTLRAFRRKLGSGSVPILVVSGKGDRPDAATVRFLGAFGLTISNFGENTATPLAR
jgi:AMP-binding enzyme